MRRPYTDRHRDLFIVLFWIFEALFVASVAVIFRTDSPFHPEPINKEAGIIEMASFVGLFAVSFLLNRSARHLANVGWLILFAAIWVWLLFPRL